MGDELRTAFPFNPGNDAQGTNVETMNRGRSVKPQLPKKRSLIGALFVAALWGVSAEAAPRRVVSLNMCTDQLLLTLADPEQIASLSPLALDRDYSFLAGKAEGLALNSGRGESILMGGADLVLAGAYDSGAKRDLLTRQGIPVLVVPPWRDLAGGRAQIREVARRLGHPERGERLIAEIDEALARVRSLVSPPRSILVYGRRGWVPEARSFVNEILAVMGFTLHQNRLGLEHGGLVRLESIMASPPDYALVGDTAQRALDQGSALFVHPALVRAIPPERRLSVPDALTICGGPSTPALIAALERETRAKVR